MDYSIALECLEWSAPKKIVGQKKYFIKFKYILGQLSISENTKAWTKRKLKNKYASIFSNKVLTLEGFSGRIYLYSLFIEV